MALFYGQHCWFVLIKHLAGACMESRLIIVASGRILLQSMPRNNLYIIALVKGSNFQVIRILQSRENIG